MRLWVAAALALAGCSQSNNVLFGRVENTVGGHKVVVTDCYRTSLPQPEQLSNADWRWAPCRDAEVVLRAGELEVNGRSYGKIGPADSILVDHGVVSVQKN